MTAEKNPGSVKVEPAPLTFDEHVAIQEFYYRMDTEPEEFVSERPMTRAELQRRLDRIRQDEIQKEELAKLAAAQEAPVTASEVAAAAASGEENVTKAG